MTDLNVKSRMHACMHATSEAVEPLHPALDMLAFISTWLLEHTSMLAYVAATRESLIHPAARSLVRRHKVERATSVSGFFGGIMKSLLLLR